MSSWRLPIASTQYSRRIQGCAEAIRPMADDNVILNQNKLVTNNGNRWTRDHPASQRSRRGPSSCLRRRRTPAQSDQVQPPRDRGRDPSRRRPNALGYSGGRSREAKRQTYRRAHSNRRKSLQRTQSRPTNSLSPRIDLAPVQVIRVDPNLPPRAALASIEPGSPQVALSTRISQRTQSDPGPFTPLYPSSAVSGIAVVVLMK
jgi:hypothetical protein